MPRYAHSPSRSSRPPDIENFRPALFGARELPLAWLLGASNPTKCPKQVDDSSPAMSSSQLQEPQGAAKQLTQTNRARLSISTHAFPSRAHSSHLSISIATYLTFATSTTHTFTMSDSANQATAPATGAQDNQQFAESKGKGKAAAQDTEMKDNNTEEEDDDESDEAEEVSLARPG